MLEYLEIDTSFP